MKGLVFAAALMLAPLPLAAADLLPEPGKVAILAGLDKTTARVMQFNVPIGGTSHFGTLDITVRDCRRHPPEEPPESAAFLDIQETKPGAKEATALFNGWMFSSSPAVSALEHPIYDVWVIDCIIPSGSEGKQG